MNYTKRVKCIRDDRPDLGPRVLDNFIRKGKFYNVLNPSIPGPCENHHDWIEIQNPETGETYERPRYMFGPILSKATRCSNPKSE